MLLKFHGYWVFLLTMIHCQELGWADFLADFAPPSWGKTFNKSEVYCWRFHQNPWVSCISLSRLLRELFCLDPFCQIVISELSSSNISMSLSLFAFVELFSACLGNILGNFCFSGAISDWESLLPTRLITYTN